MVESMVEVLSQYSRQIPNLNTQVLRIGLDCVFQHVFLCTFVLLGVHAGMPATADDAVPMMSAIVLSRKPLRGTSEASC